MRSLKLITDSFLDLLISILPRFKKRSGFAFIVHPRDIKDITRKYHFLKVFSDKKIKLIMRLFWPVTVSKIEGVYNKKTKEEIKGWTISCPITAEQMLNDRELAKKFIIKTAKLAEKKGAVIIGLGALTASLTRGGLDIKEHINCKITTGRIFTSKTITDITAQIVQKLDLNRASIKISIVGAAGSIGSGSAQILAKNKFKNINLIDLSNKESTINEIKKILQEINPKINTTSSVNLDSLKEADLIIAATNRPDALIMSHHLKKGAIIVDDAQPSDVDINVIKNRPDVLVLEGGAVNAKNIKPNFKFGLKEEGDLFSCLAEVILLSYSGIEIEENLGEIKNIDFKVLEKFTKISEEIGMKIAKFQNSFKIYTEKDLAFVKNIIKNRNT